MRKGTAIWLVLVVLLPVSSWALVSFPLPPDELHDGGSARVTTVIDGDTVILDDGRQVRLVGIQAPKLPLGRPNFQAWPLGEEAQQALQELVLDTPVDLRLAPSSPDRHGRVLAHLVVAHRLIADGRVWVQGDMLRQGLARVYTFPDNRVLADELLALEREARSENRGIWALPYYALRTPDNVRHDTGTFQIVEGRVLDTARVKKRIYLNFGADWRSDFTIKVDTRHETLFREQGIDLLTLKGQRVRVRGWIKSQNGPMIELDHPERLELPDRVR